MGDLAQSGQGQNLSMMDPVISKRD